MSKIKMSHYLLGLYPYNELNDELKQQVVAHAKVKEYSKGSLIFQRGKISPYLFYLVEGKVDLINANFETLTVSIADYQRFMDTQSSPYRESAVAKTPVKMLVVERDYLDLLMMWNSQANESAGQSKQADLNDSDWMSGLIGSPLFGHIPPAHLQQLFSRFELVEMKKSVPIIRQGETGEFFYVVRQGKVRISAINSDINVELDEGKFFGEEALIAETPRNATVTPLEDGWLMRLNKEDFKALLEEPVINYMSYEELVEYAAADQPLQIVDVRLGVEYKNQHLPGSLNIPLKKLRARLGSLPNASLYLITSDAGRRAEVAAHLMCQAGLRAVILKDVEAHYVGPSKRNDYPGSMDLPESMAG